MKFTQEQIDKANGLDIVEVAEKLKLPIKRQGRIVYTHCLWHADGKRPSLQLGGRDAFKSQCHCYVCQKSWGVVSLVMESEKCSFPEAMEWICDQFTIHNSEFIIGRSPPTPILKFQSPQPQVPIPSTQVPHLRHRR